MQEELLSSFEIMCSTTWLASKKLIFAFQLFDFCHQGPRTILKMSNFLSIYVGVNNWRNPGPLGFYDVSERSGEVGPSFLSAICS